MANGTWLEIRRCLTWRDLFISGIAGFTSFLCELKLSITQVLYSVMAFSAVGMLATLIS